MDVRRVPVDQALKWLPPAEARPTHVYRVRELLPSGYVSYLRIFHPFVAGEWAEAGLDTPPGPRTWRSLAAEAGVVYHPELVWRSLEPVIGGAEGPRPLWVREGLIDDPTRSALFDALSYMTGNQPAFFYFGLARIVWGLEPSLFSAPVPAVEAACASAWADVKLEESGWPAGPEYVWPRDRSWLLSTDYDLTSSYIACNKTLGDVLIADDQIEVLPVSLDTRIDDDADVINGKSFRKEP
jgi:hypothetical protein